MVRLLILTVLILGPLAALAQTPQFSGNQVMRGCRADSSKALPSDLLILAGVCIGMVRAFITIPDRVMGYCAPAGATVDQGMRVVTAYLDRNPQYLHVNFDNLIVHAFRAAWPCR